MKVRFEFFVPCMIFSQPPMYIFLSIPSMNTKFVDYTQIVLLALYVSFHLEFKKFSSPSADISRIAMVNLLPTLHSSFHQECVLWILDQRAQLLE